MANPRVLVVDDDPVARQYLAEVLQGLAAQVDLADCGTRAHALASTQRYELLIVDRRLPDAEAGAWLQALRTDRGARSRTTTAIVQSAELLAADRARLLAAGYSAAHEKPIPRGVLAALVGGRHSAPPAAIAAPDDCVGEGRELPVLDDRAGLESCGTRDILLGLRQLLHAELAQHRRDLAQAFAAKDSAAIDALIHRLTGAARYCGTPALQMALSRVQASEPELAPQALDHLLAAIDMLATHLAPRPA